MDLRAEGRRWAVATPHETATAAAVAAFEGGGNAVDAALSAAITLAVVYPHMCGAGGDLFALVRRPDGKTQAITSAGAAPAKTDPDAVRSRHGGIMPAHGPDTVTVPGAVAGWMALHDLGARIEWQRAFTSGIVAATTGTPVSRSLASALRDATVGSDPGLRDTFFDGNAPLAEGAASRQPALAATLGKIAKDGPEALYAGPIGERYAAGLRKTGCALAEEDLSAHTADIGYPLRSPYRNASILTCRPPSQGFALLRILSSIERDGLDPDPLGTDAAGLARAFAEASSVRDLHLSDPAHMLVPVEGLIDGSFPDAAGPQQRGGSGDTISLSTADSHGWAVSLIQSLYDSFGSGILEQQTGIIAHDRGACFTLQPGHPNELAPGKRPAHTLMPVLVEDESGELAAVVGTRGGHFQPQINAQNLMRVLDQGMEPEDALAAPRWLVEGDRVLAETGVPTDVTDALGSSGLQVEQLGEDNGTAGHSSVIMCGRSGFRAAADPRSDGAAAAG